MHIGLNLWTAPNTWWPAGASYAADFAADRYMREGEPVTADAAYGLARGSAKYAADSSGSFVRFETDIAARTDCGLSVEPASSTVLANPVGLDLWGKTMASASPLGGPVLGIFTHPMLVTDTTGHALARLQHPEDQSVSTGQAYAISCWLQAGSTPNVTVIAIVNNGSSRVVLGLPDGVVTTSTSGRGPLDLISLSRHGADSYCARLLWTPNFSGVCTVAIGPGTGVMGDDVVVLGAFMEPGTRFTSPMIGSRAADAVTLHLPGGTHELTVTFEDGTTQAIAGVAGDYVLPALDGTVIRSIVAG